MQPCFHLSATLPGPPHTRISAPALSPITLGDVKLDVPIILAPMASVTHPPFRRLCTVHGARLTISEMLHASLYLANRSKPHFHDRETRSVQLYGTDASTLSTAAARLVEEERVRHVDLNFGCPAPKILRRGGGAAVAADIGRFEGILSEVVRACGRVPVTCKLRAGVAGRETWREAGRVAEACGVAAVTLHARMAEQGYDRGLGRAGWWRIRELREGVGIPVFGNGDVFSGRDAVEMVRETGCAGVVVGRGALGRPWLFGDILDAFAGGEGVTVPRVDVVLPVMQRFVRETVEYSMALGMSERRAVMGVRKWYGWFLQGYRGCEGLVEQLVKAESVDCVAEAVAGFSGRVSVDVEAVLRERGKLGRE